MIQETLVGRVVLARQQVGAFAQRLLQAGIRIETLHQLALGDVAPLAHLTKTQVVQLGKCCELPNYLIEKAPEDGLTGKTDEDNFGFTYDFLDKYIRTGDFGGDTATAAKIDRMHEANLFKDLPMPTYDPTLFNWLF